MSSDREEKLSGRKDLRGEIASTARWSWLLRTPVHIGLLLIIGLGLYLHTLHAPFILDDYSCIKENPAIRGFEYFTDFDKVRALPIWNDIKNNFALRPVVYLTFALNYRLGGLDEFGYHLVNIAIHLINAVLVYLLARVTLQRAALPRPEGGEPRVYGLIPLLAALLFVAHPLQTQAVTYINQRFTSLATLFYLSALLLYVAARTAKAPASRWLCCGFSLLVTLAAMKTKEDAFTLPLMLLLYDLFFLEGRLRQRLLGLAPFFLALLVIPGTLIWLVATDGVDDPRTSVEQSVNLANFSGVGQWDYLKTQFGAIITYLRLLLLPVGQNLIPAYPLAQSFFEPKIIGSFLLLLVLLGGGIWLGLRSFKAQQRSAGRLIAFGILWFFVTISMSSSIIPLDAMLLEYRVYLPSFGVFVAVAVAAATAVDRGWISYRVFIGGAVVTISLLSVVTYARNDVYTDKVRILQDVLAKNPSALPARIGLAYTFLELERFDEAIVELSGILQAIPNDPNMIANLGHALYAKGRTDEAVGLYRRALEISPDNAYAHGNLGFAYLDMGLAAAAETELHNALAIDPHFGAARQRLAVLYEEQGRIAEAIEQYRALLRSYPDNRYMAEKLRMLGGG